MELNLPDYVLDMQRTTKDMMYGSVPLEFVVARGQITKVVGSRTHSFRFKTTDEALLFIIDHIKTTLKNESERPADDHKDGGTITFSVAHKDGRISLINTFDQIEYNYPM